MAPRAKKSEANVDLFKASPELEDKLDSTSEQVEVKPEEPVTVPKARELRTSDLDEAAKMLLRALPDFAVKGIDLAAHNQSIPLWMEVCGLLMADFQAGTLYSPNIDPSWHSANPILQEEAVCGECGVIFTPKVRAQKFCSNKCGSIYNIKQSSAG